MLARKGEVVVMRFIRSGCMLLLMLTSKSYQPLFSYVDIPDTGIVDTHIIDAQQDYIEQAEQFIDDCLELGLQAKTDRKSVV